MFTGRTGVALEATVPAGDNTLTASLDGVETTYDRPMLAETWEAIILCPKALVDCSPGDVSTYAPEWKPSNGLAQGLWTPEQPADYGRLCLGECAHPVGCDASTSDPDNAACLGGALAEQDACAATASSSSRLLEPSALAGGTIWRVSTSAGRRTPPFMTTDEHCALHQLVGEMGDATLGTLTVRAMDADCHHIAGSQVTTDANNAAGPFYFAGDGRIETGSSNDGKTRSMRVLPGDVEVSVKTNPARAAGLLGSRRRGPKRLRSSPTSARKYAFSTTE